MEEVGGGCRWLEVVEGGWKEDGGGWGGWKRLKIVEGV